MSTYTGVTNLQNSPIFVANFVVVVSFMTDGYSF